MFQTTLLFFMIQERQFWRPKAVLTFGLYDFQSGYKYVPDGVATVCNLSRGITSESRAEVWD